MRTRSGTARLRAVVLVGAVVAAASLSAAQFATADSVGPPAQQPSGTTLNPGTWDVDSDVVAAQDGRVAGPAPIGLSKTSPSDDVVPVVAEELFRRGAKQGFAGQETNYDDRSIRVWWSGEVPSDVSEYADSRPYGVRITIVSGPISRQDAEAARERLWASELTDSLQITSISVRHDGTGLEVSVSLPALSDQQVKDLKRVAATELIRTATAVPAAKGYATRQADAAPWKGGAAMIVNGAGCSTGFAVLSGTAGRLINARHAIMHDTAIRQLLTQLRAEAASGSPRRQASRPSRLSTRC